MSARCEERRDRRRATISARPKGGLSAQRTGCAGVKPAAERSDRRRATVILIQRGDPEIAGAIAEGMMAARGNSLSHGGAVTAFRGPAGPSDGGLPTRSRWEQSTGLFPETLEPLVTVHRTASRAFGPSGRAPFGDAEGVEIVSAGVDRQKIVAHLVRVAVGNDKTAEDYRHMIVKARGLYEIEREPGPLRVFAGKLVLGWALICLGVRRAYRAQDRVLGRAMR